MFILCSKANFDNFRDHITKLLYLDFAKNSFDDFYWILNAYGLVIDGKVLPGYSATIDINGQLAKVKIKGVVWEWAGLMRMGRPDENGNMQWGLILEFESTVLEKIAATNRKEQTIAVYEDTISIEDLNTVLYKLQQLLYGYNYEVLFGVEIFNNCENLDHFKVGRKERFPNSMAESVVPVPVSVDDFWREIEIALEYRVVSQF